MSGPEGVLTFCVLLQESQQQALLEGHVAPAGQYPSFGLALMRADLQVCIHKAVPKATKGNILEDTFWQWHLDMLAEDNAGISPEAIWLGISAAACCVVCSSIYTVGPAQQNHRGSCAWSFNASKLEL